MKILVTGAAGQLGQEVQSVLATLTDTEIVYTDIDTLDITDVQALTDFVDGKEFTHIINCAAYTAVDAAESSEGQTACYRLNVDALRNIASVAAREGIKVLHVSTDYVFDGNSSRPYRESDKVNPISHYGISKRRGEMALLAMCPDAIIIRTAWLYSPHGRNFVLTMLRLAAERRQLRVVSDQVGTPTYAADLAEAIRSIVTARQWLPGIYNFTDEGVCSWYDLAVATLEAAGIEGVEVIPISTDDYPTPAARPAYSVLDKQLIRRTYGIAIPHWQASLRKCINRIKQNS